jgi:hypothetical protein
MTEIEVDAREHRHFRVGDLFTFEGVDIGRIDLIEGSFVGKVTMRVIPNLLYWAKVVAIRGRREQRVLHLTNQPQPCHDPPVGWRVEDHPLAKLGIPVIVNTGLPPGRWTLDGVPRYMNPEPVLLDEEPGRRQ